MDWILLIGALLLLVSVVASKISDRLGIPSLLLFLMIGIFAGNEGLRFFHFQTPMLAKSIGTLALALIIFSGGLDTGWSDIRPILRPGLLLSTVGVLVTTTAVGWFAQLVLHFSLLEGLLLGAVVASTDAAAVFSVLRSSHARLKGPLKPMLEFESGSNDPMAVFLTLGLIHLLQTPQATPLELIPRFLFEMGIGALLGLVLPKAGILLINRIRLNYEGLYPVLTLSLVLITYAATTVLHGNGFLAVYLAGLLIGNNKFIHKKSLKRFHEGLAWLMQIAMFLTLGLLIVPSQTAPFLVPGFLISFFLILVARPLAVWLCLLKSPFTFKEKLLVSWVGLRGAAPIILATFPLLAGIPSANIIFQIVFFIVTTSILLQGTLLPAVARLLGLSVPSAARHYSPLDLEEIEGIDANLHDLLIPYQSRVVGKTIFEMSVPRDCLIVMISKEDRFLIPNGSTRLEGGDVLFVLANPRDLADLQKIIAQQKPASEEEN